METQAEVLTKVAALEAPNNYKAPIVTSAPPKKWYWLGTRLNPFFGSACVGQQSFPESQDFQVIETMDRLVTENAGSMPNARDKRPGVVVQLTEDQIARLLYESERQLIRPEKEGKRFSEVNLIQLDEIAALEALMSGKPLADPKNKYMTGFLERAKGIPKEGSNLSLVNQLSLRPISQTAAGLYKQDSDIPVASLVYCVELPPSISKLDPDSASKWRPFGCSPYRNSTLPKPICTMTATQKAEYVRFANYVLDHRDEDSELNDTTSDLMNPRALWLDFGFRETL